MKNLSAFFGWACVPAFIILHSTFSLRAEGNYTVTARGPDYRVLEKVEVVNGTNRIHRYTELATGLNYTNASGQLVEAKEQITILPTGGAAATQGRHKVYFPGNLYNGVLEIVTPDGKHLRSRPLGVTYDDGSNTVFIATLTNTVGYLVNSNLVLYRNAFCGIKADLLCTYRRSGFECDLVFRQQPPTPGDYGLDENGSTLNMVTEFFNTPDPQQIPAGYDDWFALQDSTLKFGKLTMTRGKAFAFNNTNGVFSRPLGGESRREGAVPVYKSWVKVDGRKFLVESVPVIDLVEDLNALPLTAKAETGKAESRNGMLAKKQSFQSHILAADFHPLISEKDTNQILLASADFTREPGVVLDYTTVDSDQADFVFQAGQTYYISAPVHLSGTVAFEGGAVLKYGGDEGSLNLAEWDESTGMIWPTSLDNPVFFTTATDDSVGESVPANGYTGNYINCTWYNHPSIRNARIKNAGTVMTVNTCGGDADQDHISIWHSRLENCGNAIVLTGGCSLAAQVEFYNVLANGVGLLAWGDAGLSVHCEHVTLVPYSQLFWSGSIWPEDWAVCSLTMVNCIWHNSLYCGFEDFPRDHCYITASYDPGTYPWIPENDFFRSGTGGEFYLGSMAHGLEGTTAINPDLLADLQTMTTYAPQDGGAPDTDTPDLGYHYPVNEDSDHDGLPDWWEWHWFRSFSLSGTNVDGYGDTLLSDYQHGEDPNVIFYSLSAENNFVVNGAAVLGAEIDCGLPAYYAVLVDTTNFSTASWTAYTGTSVPVNLGNTEGWHKVWVGLKGFAPEATATWQYKRFFWIKRHPA